MAVSTSEPRRNLGRLIERVNLDRTEIEVVSKRGSAVLMEKDQYDALVETSNHPLINFATSNALRVLEPSSLDFRDYLGYFGGLT